MIYINHILLHDIESYPQVIHRLSTDLSTYDTIAEQGQGATIKKGCFLF